MRHFFASIACFLISLTALHAANTTAWIRINQAGYLPEDIKTAVLISQKEVAVDGFSIVDVRTGEAVYKGTVPGQQVQEARAEHWGMAK
ncbi:MAG: cellulase N-terminal Ig-like domain-containing protein, partial [Bacteroidales bacterium]|nr:cellulase N-terminal Ig-like domain-containing protein [Bacteroidales bacterium]